MHNDRISLVTGANSGIGFETAKALAAQGDRVFLLCRNEEKGRAALEHIQQETGNERLELLTADLGSQNQLRQAGAELARRVDRLDVLVNNAGTWMSQHQLTEDGVESVIAINHLAYFLLSHLTYPLLRESAGGRIVNVSSDSHFQVRGMHFDDLHLTGNYHGLRSYAQSKLANVLFTYEFDRRKPDAHICINAVQPGLVQTDIGLKNTNWLHALAWRIRRQMKGNKTPAQGAATSVYLASHPEAGGLSGKYWEDCRPKPSSKASYDQEAAERLWQVSCEWCGIDQYFPK